MDIGSERFLGKVHKYCCTLQNILSNSNLRCILATKLAMETNIIMSVNGCGWQWYLSVMFLWPLQAFPHRPITETHTKKPCASGGLLECRCSGCEDTDSPNRQFKPNQNKKSHSRSRWALDSYELYQKLQFTLGRIKISKLRFSQN